MTVYLLHESGTVYISGPGFEDATAESAMHDATLLISNSTEGSSSAIGSKHCSIALQATLPLVCTCVCCAASILC